MRPVNGPENATGGRLGSRKTSLGWTQLGRLRGLVRGRVAPYGGRRLRGVRPGTDLRWEIAPSRSRLRRADRYALRLGRGLALGRTFGEERSLTVASLLRFGLGIEVGARFGLGMDLGFVVVEFVHRTYRPAGLLAVKQESPPNGGRIPFQAGNRRCLWVDPSVCITLTLRFVWP